MKRYYLIGDPAAHSLSPAIYTKLYEIYGIRGAVYEARTVPAGGLEAFVRSMPGDVRGFNVTMPHKERVIPYLAKTDASVCGSVNTVVVKEDGLHGYSTDARGFYTALAKRGFEVRGKNIVFMGAGGVTPPLIDSALKMGTEGIVVVNRTLERAQALQRERVRADSLQNLARYLGDCDLLINATALGMAGGQEHESFAFLDALQPSAMVCDLLYAPRKTQLLLQAERRGHKVMGGLPMLIWQAFYAFEIYFGILPGEREYAQIEGLL